MSKTTISPIRAYRQAAGLSQTEFGKLFGVLAPAVCKWEEGKVSVQYALAVHKATGIPLHDLRPDIYPAPEHESAS